jgi:ATP-dependent RNA helicase MSS116
VVVLADDLLQLVLDEADTLLDMGFRDDIEAVNAYLPPKTERQTFLFSATVSPAIHQIATKTMDKHHMFINTVSDDTSPVHAHIPQFHTILNNASEQIPHLLRLITQDQLANYGKSKIIVFLPTTKMTQLFTTLLRTLKRDGVPAGRSTEIYEIHSKKSQESRTNTSDNFRRDVSGASVLVTSDVSARGVDYPNVTRVIQIGIPGSPEQYVHRVGRTGRRDLAGRGDLVLLPWEAGFVTYRLADIPIKPLRTEELTQQVLAAKIDSEGLPHLDRPRQTRPDRFDPRSRDRRYSQQMTINLPVAPALENLETKVKGLLQDLDSEAINETFTSILGYYFGKSGELRCDKEVILEGCKQYTVDGLGLTEAPYVSRAFLEKIGFSEPRRRQPSRDGSRNRGGMGGMRNDRPRFGFRQSRDAGDHDTPSEGSGSRSGSGFDRSRPRFGTSNNFERQSGGFERQSGGFERHSRPRTPSGDRDGWSSRGQGSGQGSGRFNRSSRYDDSSRRPALGNN